MERYGLRNTRLYGIWNGIKQRCNNPNRPKYKSYGGRGIKVCNEWNTSFKSFYDWAMANGYRDDLTIDRIDVNGNYEPSNCRWTSLKEQSYNKTTSKFISYNGEVKTLAEWAQEYGIKYGTLFYRIKNGWDIGEALNESVSKSHNKKRAITQCDKSGVIIREWESTIDAANGLSISQGNINNCLKGRTKTAYGFIWKYRKE